MYSAYPGAVKGKPSAKKPPKGPPEEDKVSDGYRMR